VVPGADPALAKAGVGGFYVDKKKCMFSCQPQEMISTYFNSTSVKSPMFRMLACDACRIVMEKTEDSDGFFWLILCHLSLELEG
jgi:hypothetical protein